MGRATTMQLLGLLLAACAGPKVVPEASPHVAPGGSAQATGSCADGDLAKCHADALALEHGSDSDMARALVEFRNGCEAAHLPSCSALGWRYEIGLGVEVDAKRAVALYRRACDGGAQDGCVRLATAMYYGELGMRHDLSGSRKLFQHACDAGDAEGCGRLGSIHLYGAGVAEDTVRGREMMEDACGRGAGPACRELGQRYEHDDHDTFRRDLRRALDMYQRGCKAHHATSCLDLSWLFVRGFGVKRDLKRGFELGEIACRLGSADACANLGHAYFMGEPVARDLGRAVRLSADACRRLSERGCRNLGIMLTRPEIGSSAADEHRLTYEHIDRLCARGDERACQARDELTGAELGRTEDQLRQDEEQCHGGSPSACDQLGWNYEWGEFYLIADAKKAAAAYRRSCDHNYQNGCVNYGWTLMRGFGTDIDLSQANALFNKACIDGNHYGCNNMGWSLEQGLGTAQSHLEALEQYRLACDANNDLGCGNLGELLRDLGRVSEAKVALERGCRLNHNGSCRWLAEILLATGNDRDRREARDYLQTGCEHDRYVECGLRNELDAR